MQAEQFIRLTQCMECKMATCSAKHISPTSKVVISHNKDLLSEERM